MLVNVTYTVQYMEWDGMREYDMKLWYEYIYIYRYHVETILNTDQFHHSILNRDAGWMAMKHNLEGH